MFYLIDCTISSIRQSTYSIATIPLRLSTPLIFKFTKTVSAHKPALVYISSYALNGKDCEWRFDFIKYPNPKFSRAIKAVNTAETEKLMSALLRMHQEDPTWLVEQSKELRQTIVRGQGEFHLRTLKWRLENNEKLAIKFEPTRIPYRETIDRKSVV